MTTRKLNAALLSGALGAWSLGLAGCATPGPLHIYSIASPTAETIIDEGPAPTHSTPTFVAPGDTITGFAYDPFTDHFFLRLAPGNKIRVIDRPARVVKREFTIEKLPSDGGGDLAVRPRDGHLFFTLPAKRALLETTRFGEFVRETGLQFPAAGVALDTERNLLLVSYTTMGGTVGFHDGNVAVTDMNLSQALGANSIAYDTERHQLYSPLAGEKTVGVFDESGQLLRTLPLAAEFLDVGPRSFLRMF